MVSYIELTEHNKLSKIDSHKIFLNTMIGLTAYNIYMKDETEDEDRLAIITLHKYKEAKLYLDQSLDTNGCSLFDIQMTYQLLLAKVGVLAREKSKDSDEDFVRETIKNNKNLDEITTILAEDICVDRNINLGKVYCFIRNVNEMEENNHDNN